MYKDDFCCPHCGNWDSKSKIMPSLLLKLHANPRLSKEERDQIFAEALLGKGVAKFVSCGKCGGSIVIREIFAGRHDGGSCFVATAIYGGVESVCVEDLRRFRDRQLAPSRAGRTLIRAYNRVGPPMAAWIRRHPSSRCWLRPLFDIVAYVVSIVFSKRN